MVPKKTQITSSEENLVTEQENLEQTVAETESEVDFAEEELVIDENSLVFSDNKGMICKRKSVSETFARIRNLIIVFTLAVALVFGTIWVVNFVQEDIAQNNLANTSIPIKKINSNAISKIVIKGRYEEVEDKKVVSTEALELIFTSEMVEEEGSKIAKWKLEGFDKDLIADSSVNAAADSLATMYANRIMEEDQSKKAVYGLENPLLTAEVTMRDGSKGYTVTVGDQCPDQTGYYLTVTGDKNIYLVSAGTVNSFYKKPEKFANTVIIETPTKENMEKKTDAKYFDDSGVLTKFDSIELSGTKYGQGLTLKTLENNDFAKYFVQIGDHSRVADNDKTDEMLGLLTNGLVAIDTYKLCPNEDDIKKYGLDNPEIIVKIRYGSGYTEVKASVYEEETDETLVTDDEEETEEKEIRYAVMINGRDAIYSVLSDAVPMFDYNVSDFYNQFAFLEYIYDFEKIDINTVDGEYSFEIDHNTKDDTFTATANGKSVDDTLLSVYYQYLLTLEPEEKDSYIEGEPSYTAVLTYKDGEKGKKTFELIKQTERRYLLRVDGVNYGVIISTKYDALTVYVNNVIKGQEIPEP